MSNTIALIGHLTGATIQHRVDDAGKDDTENDVVKE
jgi:hypothetical protein